MSHAPVSSAPVTDQDPLAPAGLTFAVLGGLSAGIGGVVFATTKRDDSLGPSSARVAGAGLLGGGLTAVALGLPMFAFASPERSADRQNETLMITGLALTTLGASFIVAGTSINRADPGHAGDGLQIKVMVAGGVLAVAGVPMWFGGASSPDAGPAPYSLAMKYSGVALVILGSLGLTAGALLATAGGAFAGSAGLAILGGGAAALAVGIPLWIIGGSKNDATAKNAMLRPKLSLGPGFVAWSASFD